MTLTLSRKTRIESKEILQQKEVKIETENYIRFYKIKKLEEHPNESRNRKKIESRCYN